MATRDVAAEGDRQSRIWIILLCFFASGMSGLVYQVVWVRELVLVFGATTFAVSTVLTAFMGGLALGSYYFGKRSASVVRPLRLYGLLEIGIGVYGLAIPFIFQALPPVYHLFWRWLHLSFFALSLVRFVFAAAILILPTALMGATLPVLASYYARDLARIGLRVGSLYSVNTFGAVLGAALTGFVLIPLLGMSATTGTAAAINLLLGLVALRLDRFNQRRDVPEPRRETVQARGGRSSSQGTEPIAADKQDPAERRRILSVMLGFGTSGFIALSYEVIWSRVLALIIGSSVYAFSIMLTTFLVGLAIGSAVASRMADRIRNPMLAFAFIELGIGISSIIGAFLFNDLPFYFVELYRMLGGASFGILLVARFLIASLVMIVPTLLLGALFPIVVRIVSGSSGRRTTGRVVGDAYAANTIGAILGSFASGFILVPWLGLLGSLKLSAAANFVVAALIFSAGSRATHKRAKAGRKGRQFSFGTSFGVAASLIFATGAALVSPPWDPEIMSSAVYRYAPSLAGKTKQEIYEYLSRGQGETLFYKEGISATIAVQQQQGGKVLKANGKPEASTTGDMPTQILIGTLPLLVRPKTDDVLLIGLGSGVTLGSIEQFPIRQVTCVELEPAIVEASHFFEDVNNRPLADPRLRLISNDGRNFIYTTSEKFDVIVSEPSNPWLTGVANLFTLEYFTRGAQRLKPGGLFSQWLQIYEMAPEDVRTLIATFRAAFPCVYLFRGAEGDLMLLGSNDPQRIDLSVLQSHFVDSRVAVDMRRIETTRPTDIVSRFYLGPEEVTEFTRGAQVNTDNNALIEFNAPRRVGTAEETVERNRKQLVGVACSPLAYVDLGDVSDKSKASLLVDAALSAARRDDRDRAEQFVTYSLEFGDSATAHTMLGEFRLARGDDASAIESWKTALALDPANFYALINLGKYYLTKQDLEHSIPYLDRAMEIEPESARAHHLRGLAYQASGDNAHAVAEYRKALPDAAYAASVKTFYLNFGAALMQLGWYEEARQMLEQYARLEPNDFEGHFQLGAACEILGEGASDDILTQRAIEELKWALSINSSHAMSHYYLSKAYRRMGLLDRAQAEFEQYERLSP
jgi:spermidine synthase